MYMKFKILSGLWALVNSSLFVLEQNNPKVREARNITGYS
jgi:hypothetical protein